MDEFETLLNKYFSKPYRPEYLVRQVINEIKSSNYNFEIIKESNNIIIENNFNKIYKSIFPDDKINFESYVFIEGVQNGESIKNFKNLIYESCKLHYDNINKKEIILYLFVLNEYKDRIINTIYRTVLNKSIGNIYGKLFQNFIYLGKNKYNISKNYFDHLYLTKYINSDESKMDNSPKDISNKNDFFNIENIKINYLKYEYYGPDQTKNNYILNEYEENNKMKVRLFSPDFLLKKKIINKYSKDNFQVYNKDNACPGLFIYMINDAIEQLNNEINGLKINNDIISNFGIIYFEDKTVGLYLNMIKSTDYYEIGNLTQNLMNINESDKLEIVCYSSTSRPESKVELRAGSETKTIKEENKLTNQQEFFAEYNSHVLEEQLALLIINEIGHEILDQSMERLPRIIFYFNLYIFESQNEKRRIAFTPKEIGYGFEEADGVFYLDSKDVKLKKPGDIPFLHNIGFILIPFSSSFEISEKSEIEIKKNSLIIMEVKYSFPLKYNDKKEIIGINETSSLIYKIIRRAKKFYEIAIKQKKNIHQIHILFLYDSLMPKDEDLKNFKMELQKIFQNLKIEIKKRTIFDIIYFVNPASLNVKRLADIVHYLKNQNEESNKKINDLESNDKFKQSQINNLIKENEESNKKIKDLEKDIANNQLEINKLKTENKSLRLSYQLEIDELIKHNDENMKKLLEKIVILEKNIDEMKNDRQNNENLNNNQEINQINIIENDEDLNDLNMNDIELNNIVLRINKKITEKKEKIYNIKGLKNGAIYFASNNAVYIVKKNSDSDIITLNGYRNVILQLKNGNVLTSQSTNIFIYSDNNFSDYKKIRVNCYPRQIIELEKENEFLILSEESELKILKGDAVIQSINAYKSEYKISSIKELNKNEISILLENKTKKNNDSKILIFYDLKEKEKIKGKEIKRIELQSKPKILNYVDLHIYNNNLYIPLFDALFKIDITKKTLIEKTNFGFSKFYRCKNYFLGIKKNEIYYIYEGNNSVIQNKKIYEEVSSNIYCLYPIKEKKLIVSTEKEIKYYELN